MTLWAKPVFISEEDGRALIHFSMPTIPSLPAHGTEMDANSSSSCKQNSLTKSFGRSHPWETRLLVAIYNSQEILEAATLLLQLSVSDHLSLVTVTLG
ncbi:hypothetical protein TNCV_2730461 [Trichonephila clavipes]|nr:hypothetical protein TNCV_2730461 [Trichonephila clavipes]